MSQYVFHLIHRITQAKTSVGFQVHTLKQAYQEVDRDYPDYEVEDVEIYPM